VLVGAIPACFMASCANSVPSSSPRAEATERVSWHAENAIGAESKRTTTCRFIATLSGSGSALRVEFSAGLGGTGFAVGPASIAVATSATTLQIKPSTSHGLTFGGQDAASVVADGSVVVSDPVAMKFRPGTVVAVTVTATAGSANYRYDRPEAAGCTDGEPSQSATASAAVFAQPARTHWVSGIRGIGGSSPSLLVLGDSLSSSSYRWSAGPYRWSDLLVPSGAWIANASVGDAEITRGGLYGSQNSLQRLKTLLFEPGLRYVLIQVGNNDIVSGADARTLLAALSEAVNVIRAESLVPLVATLPPRQAGAAWTGVEEQTRQQVNAFLRQASGTNSSASVLDIDALLREPTAPTMLNPRFDLGNHLNVNSAGARLIANAIAQLMHK
jgi:lysophospholipase L1-like esterase